MTSVSLPVNDETLKAQSITEAIEHHRHEPEAEPRQTQVFIRDREPTPEPYSEPIAMPVAMPTLSNAGTLRPKTDDPEDDQLKGSTMTGGGSGHEGGSGDGVDMSGSGSSSDGSNTSVILPITDDKVDTQPNTQPIQQPNPEP